jgi:cell division protein FtsB
MSPTLTKVLLIAIVATLYFEVISPLYSGGGQLLTFDSTITSLRSENASYDATVEQAKLLIAQAGELKQGYEAIPEDKRQDLGVMVPTSIDPVRLIDEVNSIAEQNGFVLSDVSYIDSNNLGKGRSGYTVSFITKGNYLRFTELIKSLEKSLRIFVVTSVSFSAPTQAGDLTTFQVRLDSYYMQ